MTASKPEFAGFKPSLIKFLDELSSNNNRAWFQENKPRYETDVLEPAQAFVRAFAARLKKISPMFIADDRRVGGSLMRIYRDTRFGKDKTPYKTNVGIQFRHEFGKDVHAPGLYMHIAPNEYFLGTGMWMPETKVLAKIRTAIVDDSPKWKRIRDNKKLRSHFQLAGDRLKSAPRGFDKEHPYIEDLRRTSFIGVKQLKRQDVLSKTFLADCATAFTASRSFLRFLCEAIELPFD